VSGDSSTVELLVRLVFSLAVVLGLVWFLAKVVRARGAKGLFTGLGSGRRDRKRPDIDVLARHALTKSASLALVRVAGRDLLVGVTDSSVRVLDSLPAREEDDPLEELLELEGPPEGADPRERLAFPIPTGSTDRATDVPGLEHLRSPRTATGRQPRMNLFDALKEMTVRRH
jgi:flagellar biogenesis protein FliO